MSGYSEKDLPSNYGRDYMGRATRYARGAEGAAIRALQANGLLVGVPVEIFCAFISTGSPSSNTTDARSGKGARVAFHEITDWQITAGPALRDAAGIPRGPAPNPNKWQDPEHAWASNAWGRRHDDPRVIAALGRKAVMGHNEWRRSTTDRHAVGMCMLDDDYKSVEKNLRADLRPSAMATPWGTWCMFSSFSSGAGNAVRLFHHYATQLAAVPEAKRIPALINAVALDFAAGKQDRGNPDTHGDREHRVLRTWQKFEFARRIAREVGGNEAYFDVGLGDAAAVHERAILRANWNLSPNASSTVQPIDFTGATP
jgi:hypothetical protein